MFTDLEKIEINFPDVSFKRSLFRGYTAVVPNVYECTFQEEPGECFQKVSDFLVRNDLPPKKPELVRPFTSQALTKQRCATSLMDKIRNLKIRRLQSISAIPEEGVAYFPVYTDDFFHRHGDSDVVNFSPIECVSDDGLLVSSDKELDQLILDLFSIAVEPTVIKPEREAIVFQLDDGVGHSHLINSRTLRDRLYPQ